MAGKTRVNIWVSLFCLTGIFFSACSAQPSITTPPPLKSIEPLVAPAGAPTVQVILNAGNPGRTIPPDFLGFSFDAPTLAQGIFDQDNQPMVNLLANLGTGVLCFGAQGVEHTYWSPTWLGKLLDRVRHWGARALLSPSDIDQMLAFSRKTGWKVIFVLNLGANNPEMAADLASYVATAGRDSLLAFEVGNEPDLYYRNGLRKPNYTYSDYHKEFTSYVRAIRERVPDAPIAGPVTATTLSWFTNFLQDEAKNIVLATNHYYPLNAYPNILPSDELYASIDNMLSAKTMKRIGDVTKRFEGVTRQSNVPLRYDETNSSFPGKDGLGDVFAASLWSLDYLFTLAENRIVGANFFTGFVCHGFTPICVDWKRDYHAQALYYGLLAFSHAAKGRLVPVEITTNFNVAAHAALADDGKLRTVIINKDPKRSIQFQIVPGGAYKHAVVYRLLAGAPDADDGITFAGSPVNKDGTWFPRELEQIKPNGNEYGIVLPAASAVVVTFQ